MMLVHQDAHAQLLQGKWKGTFTINTKPSFTINHQSKDMEVYVPIELEFVLTNDTTYSVYTYTTGHIAPSLKGGLHTAKAYYELFAKDSIYIEELEIINPPNAIHQSFMKIFLKIIPKERKTILSGTWQRGLGEGFQEGRIFFKRRNSRK